MGLKMNVHPWDIHNLRQPWWQQCDMNINTSHSQPDKTCSHHGWKCESFDTLGMHWIPICPHSTCPFAAHVENTHTHLKAHRREYLFIPFSPHAAKRVVLLQRTHNMVLEYKWSTLAVTDWPVSVSSSYIVKVIGASIGTRFQHGCRETNTMKFVISTATGRDY